MQKRPQIGAERHGPVADRGARHIVRPHPQAATVCGAFLTANCKIMAHSPFKGVIPALVTPFRDGAVDEEAFVALVERQIAGGVHGLVPVGTTGETATLSP